MAKEKAKISYSELDDILADINMIYKTISSKIVGKDINTIIYNDKIYYIQPEKVYLSSFFKLHLLTKLKSNDKKTRTNLKKEKNLYPIIINLDEILKMINSIVVNHADCTEEFILNEEIFEDIDSNFNIVYSLDANTHESLVTEYSYKTFKQYYINDVDKYKELLTLIDNTLKQMNLFVEKTNIDLFDKNDNVYQKYKNRTFEEYDLSYIDFDNKNISGLDISKNLNININFDKIQKDLTDTTLNGYDLKKYKFVGWDLTNTDLRNTSATIDLASCIISFEGKMNRGTLFDEFNKLMFGTKELTEEEIENLGIKIHRENKEKKYEKRFRKN